MARKNTNTIPTIHATLKQEAGLITTATVLTSIAIGTIIGVGAVVARGWLAGTTRDIFRAFVYALTILIFYVSQAFFSLAKLISQGLVLLIEGRPITRDDAFMLAWQVIKSYGNMFIVLGLIAIAIATILRFQEYGAKKLLPKILLVALLINFSGVIMGAVIDSSNILMVSFLGSGENVGNTFGEVIGKTATSADQQFAVDDKLFEYMGKIFIVSLLYIVAGAALFYYGFLMIARYAILGLLFVFSPLAFCFSIFPATKNYWNKWLHTFLGWTFVGLSAALSLFIAQIILRELPANTQGLIISVVIIIVGMRIASKTAPMGAAAIISGATALATGGAALTLGAAKGVGKFSHANIPGVAKATEAVRSGWNAVSDMGTRAGERLGFTGKGTTAGRQQARGATRLKPYEENLENIKDNTRLAEIERTSRNTAERAAAAKILAKRNAFDIIPQSRREEAVVNAIKHGVSVNEFTKVDPDLAIHDTNAIGQEIAKLRANPSTRGLSEAAMQEEAERRVIRKAASTADKKFATEASDEDLRSMVEEGSWRGAAATDELVKREILHTVAKTPAKADMLLRNTDKYGLSSRRNYAKKDIRMAGYDEKSLEGAKNDLMSDPVRYTALKASVEADMIKADPSLKVIPTAQIEKEAIRREAVRKQAAKLTSSDLLNMNPDIIKDKTVSDELLKSPEKLRYAMQRGSNTVGKACAEIIFDDISDNIETIKPEDLTEKLSDIPKNINIADHIRSMPATTQQKIKDRIFTMREVDFTPESSKTYITRDLTEDEKREYTQKALLPPETKIVDVTPEANKTYVSEQDLAKDMKNHLEDLKKDTKKNKAEIEALERLLAGL